jgi:transaldolase/glucose-6-phosphate isomerase
MSARLSVSLGEYQGRVDAALEEMRQQKILKRIRAGDHTVWKPDPGEITNRLGWLRTAEKMIAAIPELEAFADSARNDGSTHALLLGMGGSSLAPEVFRRTFGVKDGFLDLAVLDSTDPAAVLGCAERLDPGKTRFIVSTKSGGTVETFSFFKFFRGRAEGDRFIAITDPGSKLAELAGQHGFFKTFLNDPDIGGRYSALSYFGLVPAALLGVDLKTLLERALAAAGEDDPAARLGAVLGELARGGRDKATLIMSEPIASFGDWVEQLIAESTGKEGKGILPVVTETVGPPEVYGNDRLFVYLRLDGDETHDAAVLALQEAGHPVVRLRLEDPYDLGGQMFLWEMATVVAGARLGIQPFDQPNVEAAKVLAREMVAEYKQKGALPPFEAEAPRPQAILDFLATAGDGAYVALQAFIRPTAETTTALRVLGGRLRDRTKLATTVGYGPRFLHSTGQLHKGDAGKGRFVQFIADSARDADIPDEAGSPESSMTFGVLEKAQAMGDRRALENGGRQVITFQLGGDAAGELARLAAAL